MRGISFAVQEKQIFGLLGPNGAGKSTTFGILTALLPKSQGEVILKNQKLGDTMVNLFKDIGICPQWDSLWGCLTPKEHLRLFGRMKGLKGNDLEEAVEYFINVMGLENFS